MTTDFNTIPKLLTTAELAEFLRISKTSIYRIISKRELPFYKTKGRVLFDRCEILE